MESLADRSKSLGQVRSGDLAIVIHAILAPLNQPFPEKV